VYKSIFSFYPENALQQKKSRALCGLLCGKGRLGLVQISQMHISLLQNMGLCCLHRPKAADNSFELPGQAYEGPG
jgi:hypothetical protein